MFLWSYQDVKNWDKYIEMGCFSALFLILFNSLLLMINFQAEKGTPYAQKLCPQGEEAQTEQQASVTSYLN